MKTYDYDAFNKVIDIFLNAFSLYKDPKLLIGVQEFLDQAEECREKYEKADNNPWFCEDINIYQQSIYKLLKERLSLTKVQKYVLRDMIGEYMLFPETRGYLDIIKDYRKETCKHCGLNIFNAQKGRVVFIEYVSSKEIFLCESCQSAKFI